MGAINQKPVKAKKRTQSTISRITPPTKQTASEEAISGETDETWQEHLNALKKRNGQKQKRLSY